MIGSPFPTTVMAGDAPPDPLCVWYRPSVGKRRMWKPVATAKTQAEAVAKIAGGGDWNILPVGAKPGGSARA